MAGFDIQAARDAGYTDDEILGHLSQSRRFDVEGALRNGYSKPEVIAHLGAMRSGANAQTPQKPQERGFWESAWSMVNPVPAAKAIATDPLGTFRAAAEAQGALPERAWTEAQRGNYGRAAVAGVNALIPLAGPAIQHTLDTFSEGKHREGAGMALGLLTGAALPKLASKTPDIPVVPRINRLNPREAEAVQFGIRQGIPVDAATATGSGLLRKAQAATATQIGGATVAERAAMGRAEALTRTAERLADRVSPVPVSAEGAGAAVQSNLTNRVATLKGRADQRYDALRAIESDPQFTQTVRVGWQAAEETAPGAVKTAAGWAAPVMKDVPLPIDLVPVKNALGPVRQRLMGSLTPDEISRSRGLVAINRIMEADDFVPASQADQLLSALKAETRKAQSPDLRNVSQGLAAKAMAEVEGALQNALEATGTGATRLLREGRQLTRAKYRTADSLATLGDEPVKVFDRLTQGRDQNVNLLRQVSRQAPGSMPEVARAFLEGLLETATREGGFTRSATVLNRWNAMGPATKRMLFRHPQLIRDIDSFFLLAKRMAENPNPSGTGTLATMTGGTLYTVTHPQYGIPMLLGNAALARILHGPGGAKLLMNGLRLPVGKKGATAAYATRILALAGDDARPMQGAQQ